jgi:hypothetical protein
MKKTRLSRADSTKEMPREPDLYCALADLNHRFEQIHECLARLDEAGVLRGRFARHSIAIGRATLRETCAWINFELLQVLHQRAEHDLARFERIRRGLEKPLRGSTRRTNRRT